MYYPLPYERKIYHYKKTNIDLIQLIQLIQQAICEFNWKRAFHRKYIKEKVSILKNTIFITDFH